MLWLMRCLLLPQVYIVIVKKKDLMITTYEVNWEKLDNPLAQMDKEKDVHLNTLQKNISNSIAMVHKETLILW